MMCRESSVQGVDGNPDVVELKRMLHALGYRRPALAAAFPDAPPSTNTPKMRELHNTDPAQYDKLIAESRRVSNPAGLVAARLVEALRAAYIAKKRNATQ